MSDGGTTQNRLRLREPFSQRVGFSFHAEPVRIPISTSISEGGLGHSAGASLTIAENAKESFSLPLYVTLSRTRTKIFPTESDYATADHEHRNFLFGFGRTTHRLIASGLTLNINIIPLIGGGKSTISHDNIIDEGETFTFEGSESSTTDVGTSYAFTGAWRPDNGRFFLEAGLGAYYGIQYAGRDEEANRIALFIGPRVGGGYSGESKREGGTSDTELGWVGITQGLYQLGHSFYQRSLFDRSLSKPMSALADYGFMTDSSPQPDRGSLYDVPFLEAASAFAGGMGSPLSAQLRAGDTWYWAFGALQAAGGVGFLASESEASRAGGVADLMGVARSVPYAMWEVESPGKRRTQNPEAIHRFQVYNGIANYLLGTTLFGVGLLADEDAVQRGATSGSTRLAMSPDPLGKGLVERTDVGYAVSAASSGASGPRAGILAHMSWRDWPAEDFQLFTESMLLSPLLRPSNTDAYSLNTDLRASLGLEWMTTWTRMSFGADMLGIFGGGESSTGGIGGIVGLDVLIPFNGKSHGSGLAFGMRGTAHVITPEGTQSDLLPWAGITIAGDAPQEPPVIRRRFRSSP